MRTGTSFSGKISIALISCSIIACLAFFANAAAPQNMAGERPGDMYLNTDGNIVRKNPISSVVQTDLATTTLTVITAATDREKLIIRMRELKPMADETASAAWVCIGGSVATVSSGILVDYYNPLEIEIGEDVEAAIISSAAYSLTIIQTIRSE